MNINYDRIPNHMRYAAKLYVENGIPPGSFLQAVASGDLFQAVARADEVNAAALRDWVMFFYNDVPSGCFGSREKVDAWIEIGGLNGLLARETAA